MTSSTLNRAARACKLWIAALALFTIAPVALAQSPPFADAGRDQQVSDTDEQPREWVTLDGSGSAGTNGAFITEYSWFLLAGHGRPLGTSESPTLQVQLPDGENTVQLRVTDNNGEVAYDTVDITVHGTQVNQPPVVNAGADRTVNDTDGQPGESVSLSATASDPEGQPITFTWYRVVPNDAFYLSSDQNPTLSLPDGETTLQVLVADPLGAYTSDYVVVTVNPPVVPPTANAGADREVADADGASGENVTLDGSGSTDPDGTIVSYAWYRIGDATESLGTSMSPTLQTRLYDGANTIQLVVTDNSGNTASDTVLITVSAPAPIPPTANAGADRTVNDTDSAAGENVTLDGSTSSDPDGSIVNYAWSRYIGDGYESLGSSASPTLQTRLPDGANTIRLIVTDNSGSTASDTVLITVSGPAPIPPTANAGADRTINDTDSAAGENVVLDGSASSDPDGNITYYAWSRIDGETTQSLGSSASPTLQTRLADGEHTIQLVVTDNSGSTASDTLLITVSAPAPVAPTANAGGDRVLNDTDNEAGEDVTLDGSASTDPDGNITNYAWSRLDGESTESLGSSTSPTLQVRLPDGENTIQLIVTDNSGRTDSDTVTITVNGPTSNGPPTANAGIDRTVADTDRAAGENVTLDGSASSDPDGTIANYAWWLIDGDNEESLDSSASPTLQARLPDGENTIRLVVTDNSGNRASDIVIITVSAPSSVTAPIANAGADRTVADTDGTAGENVTLDGSASSDPDGSITNYVWSRLDGETTQILGSGTSPTLQASLPDGANTLQLVVTDNEGNTASDTVLITVDAVVQIAPTANAGDDRTIADADNEAGEDVVLDGSWSADPDGTLVSYAWSRIDGENTESLGSGLSPTLQVRLADGEHTIQLVVTDNEGNTASDTVLITINAVVITRLSDLPGLTPNQKEVAQALDRICAQLRDQSGGEGAQLSGDQQDLLARCNGLQMDNSTANQVAALDELVADDFAIARTQTLLFSNNLYAGVMDRLMALRGGAKGLSLAGLNIMVDGQLVPLAQLQDMVKGLLGGGASADEPNSDKRSPDEAGGLLSDKWGLWARGNYSFGDKDSNSNSPAFDAKQWAMIGGIDYRFSDKLVGGVSLAHGQASIDIDGDQGGLDTESFAVSIYGSSYATKEFYLDAIVNVAKADYGADRSIVYVDGTGLIDVDAQGETDGMTYSAGMSGGRDFLVRGLTLSPTLGVFYIDAAIDGFTERGAGGLSLIYDEQKFQSFTGNLGFRATYAWNHSWGVLLPHVRIDYVREFKNDADVFGVRFAADPNAASTPPILVQTDNPDESYWRLATGVSAQFIHGISGYVEYQRLESFEFISFQDVSLGLRFQKSF